MLSLIMINGGDEISCNGTDFYAPCFSEIYLPLYHGTLILFVWFRPIPCSLCGDPVTRCWCGPAAVPMWVYSEQEPPTGGTHPSSWFHPTENKKSMTKCTSKFSLICQTTAI